MFGTPGIAGNAVPMHTMLASPGKLNEQSNDFINQCCTGGLGSNPVVLEQKIVTNPAAAGLVSPSYSLQYLFIFFYSSCK